MEHKRKDLGKKIEELFGDEPYQPAEEELFKWLLSAYDKDCHLKTLDKTEFGRFKEKLLLLVELVYLKDQGTGA